MSIGSNAEKNKRIEQTFAEFNESWLVYWNAYIDLQNQLYESLKTAREVTWLGATDNAKMSEINAAQRQLFSTMPRRLDYVPLGQINRSMDYALGKINELLAALFSEKAAFTCPIRKTNPHNDSLSRNLEGHPSIFWIEIFRCRNPVNCFYFRGWKAFRLQIRESLVQD